MRKGGNAILIGVISGSLLFSAVTASGQRVLRNSDFVRPPRPGVITNKDIVRQPIQGDGQGQKVTRPRRVTAAQEVVHLDRHALLTRQAELGERIDSLQQRLNELRMRVLQNRPRNPLKVGDAYYTDPDLRKEITRVKAQLLDTQIELQMIEERLDK